MPPPMPLSGAAAWKAGGNQSGSPSNSAKPGRIVSHAASGEDASAIAAWTPATKPRTTGVSSMNSTIAARPVKQICAALCGECLFDRRDDVQERDDPRYLKGPLDF